MILTNPSFTSQSSALKRLPFNGSEPPAIFALHIYDALPGSSRRAIFANTALTAFVRGSGLTNTIPHFTTLRLAIGGGGMCTVPLEIITAAQREEQSRETEIPGLHPINRPNASEIIFSFTPDTGDGDGSSFIHLCPGEEIADAFKSATSGALDISFSPPDERSAILNTNTAKAVDDDVFRLPPPTDHLAPVPPLAPNVHTPQPSALFNLIATDVLVGRMNREALAALPDAASDAAYPTDMPDISGNQHLGERRSAVNNVVRPAEAEAFAIRYRQYHATHAPMMTTYHHTLEVHRDAIQTFNLAQPTRLRALTNARVGWRWRLTEKTITDYSRADCMTELTTTIDSSKSTFATTPPSLDWIPDLLLSQLASIARDDREAISHLCALTGTPNDATFHASINRFLINLTVQCPLEAITGVRPRAMAALRVLLGNREQYSSYLDEQYMLKDLRALTVTTAELGTSPHTSIVWNCNEFSAAIYQTQHNADRLTIVLQPNSVITTLFGAMGPLSGTSCTPNGCDPTWKTTCDLVRASIESGTTVNPEAVTLSAVLDALNSEGNRVSRFVLKHNATPPTAPKAVAFGLTNSPAPTAAAPPAQPAGGASYASASRANPPPPPPARRITIASRCWVTSAGVVSWRCPACRLDHGANTTLPDQRCRDAQPPEKLIMQTMEKSLQKTAGPNRNRRHQTNPSELPCFEQALGTAHSCPGNSTAAAASCKYNHTLSPATDWNVQSQTALAKCAGTRKTTFPLDRASMLGWGVGFADLSSNLREGNEHCSDISSRTTAAIPAATHFATVAASAVTQVAETAPFQPLSPDALRQQYLDDHANHPAYITSYYSHTTDEQLNMAMQHHHRDGK